MSVSLSDKLKIMKILSTEEGREKFKETLVLKLKSQEAQEATARCIAEGMIESENVSALEISCGETSFLPLKVVVTSNGTAYKVDSIQPKDADFDYAALCEEFNALVSDNEDEKTEFLTKTAKIIESILSEKGVIDSEFYVKIAS